MRNVINTRWIADSEQFVFNLKPKGCSFMVASVDLGLGALDVCHVIEHGELRLLILGKTERSIVGYQLHYPKPKYTYTDEKLMFAFFDAPSKRRKAKVLYQDSILMVNVFGKNHGLSMVLKNKFWV